MGGDVSPSQVDTALGSGRRLLPSLAAGAEGFAGAQQELAALVLRRFKVSFRSSIMNVVFLFFTEVGSKEETKHHHPQYLEYPE